MQVVIEPLIDLPQSSLHAWRDLAKVATEENPCSEASLAANAAQTLDGGADAGLLAVRVGDRMVLALPVVPIRRFRRVPVSGIATWRHAHFTSGVPLVSEGAAHDAWAAVLDWMAATQVPWLVLETVHDGGNATAPLDDVLGQRRRRAHRFDAYQRAAVDRRPEPTYTEGRISGSRRKKLRRHRRQLAEQLGGELHTDDMVVAGGDLGTAVEEFLQLESSGWKGAEGTALASHPGDAEFFRMSCADLHAQGRLQMWRFGTADRTAAMACAAIGGHTVFHLKVAYDEEFAHFSPGVQLDLDLLEEFHSDRRLERLDSCTGGDNEGMNQLYPDRMSMATMLVASTDPRGRLAAAFTPRAARGFRRMRRIVHRVLRRPPPPDYGITS